MLSKNIYNKKSNFFENLTSNLLNPSFSKSCSFVNKIEEMKENLEGQQRFINMVVHDMRNPTEAINNGLKQARQQYQKQQKQILKDIQKAFNYNHKFILLGLKGRISRSNQKNQNIFRNTSDPIAINPLNSQFANQNIYAKRNLTNMSENFNQYYCQDSDNQNEQNLSGFQNTYKYKNDSNFQPLKGQNNLINQQKKVIEKKIMIKKQSFSEMNPRLENNNNFNNQNQIEQIDGQKQNGLIKNQSQNDFFVSIQPIDQQIIIDQIVNQPQIVNNQRFFEEEEKIPDQGSHLSYCNRVIQQNNISSKCSDILFLSKIQNNLQRHSQQNGLSNQSISISSRSFNAHNQNHRHQISFEGLPAISENINDQIENNQIIERGQNEQPMQILERIISQIDVRASQINQEIQQNQIEAQEIENQQYDFDSEGIDEVDVQQVSQQFQNSSLIINYPREMLSKEGQPYVQRHSQQIGNRTAQFIQKIVPVFYSDNTLKIERQVQTDQCQADLEVQFIQELLKNQHFKDLSFNFQDYIELINLSKQSLGRDINLQSVFSKLKEIILQQNVNNINNNHDQKLEDMLQIGQQSIQNQISNQNRVISDQQDESIEISFIHEQNNQIYQNNHSQQNLQVSMIQPKSLKKPRQIINKASFLTQYDNPPMIVRSNHQSEGHKCYENECNQCKYYQDMIIMLIQQIQKLLKLNETIDFYSQNSISSSQIILNLIEDLLTLAKIQKNVFEINIDENVNLIELVQEAFQVLSFNAEQKNIKLILQIDKSKSFLLQRVHTDKRRILQILLNFLSNSIKFTNHGGIIKIKFKILEEQIQDQMFNEQNNGYKDIMKFIKVKMQIEDNGMGIKKENLDKLFNDYQKLNEHKAINTKGTGLGLSVCKQIIELMGGKVYANSLSGIGTKFNIILQFKAFDRIFINPVSQQIETSQELIQQLMSQQGFKYTENFQNHFVVEENQYESLGIESTLNDQVNNLNQENEYNSQKVMFRFIQQAQLDNQNNDKQESHQELQKMIIKIQDFQIQQFSQMEQQSIQNNQLFSVNNDTFKYNEHQLKQDFQDISNNYGARPMSEEQNLFSNNQKNLQIRSNQSRNLESELQRNQMIALSNKMLSSISSINQNQKDQKYENQFQKQNSQKNQKQFVSFADIELSKMNPNQSHCPSILASMIESNFQENNQIEFEIKKQIQEERIHQNQIVVQQQQKINEQKIKKSPLTLKKDIYLKESIMLLKKYKQQKLRVLLANDDTYSLFVVQTTLEQFSYIQKVDAASNGQLALEFVIQNEKLDEAKTSLNKHHFYDVIFLDLEMPILNGYDACTAIKGQYKQFNAKNIQSELLDGLVDNYVQAEQNYLGSQANEIFKDHSAFPVPEWIVDLKIIYDRYQELKSKKNLQTNKLQSSNESEKLDDIEIKLIKIFNTLYANQRYQLLQYMNRPFIFAYSAMVNNQVREKTKKGGFDNCIDSPLNKLKIDKTFADYLNVFVFQMTKQMLERLGNAENFVFMLDDARIKKAFLESSSEFDKSVGSFVNTNSNLSKEIKLLNINELNNSDEIEKIKYFADKVHDSKKRIKEIEDQQKIEQIELLNKNIAKNINLSSVIEEQEKDDWSISQQHLSISNSGGNRKYQGQYEFEVEVENQFFLEQNQNDFNFNSKQNDIMYNSSQRSQE